MDRDKYKAFRIPMVVLPATISNNVPGIFISFTATSIRAIFLIKLYTILSLVFCFHNLATRNFHSQICQNPNLSAHTGTDFSVGGDTALNEITEICDRYEVLKFNLNDITTPATMRWIATVLSGFDSQPKGQRGGFLLWKLWEVKIIMSILFFHICLD